MRIYWSHKVVRFSSLEGVLLWFIMLFLSYAFCVLPLLGTRMGQWTFQCWCVQWWHTLSSENMGDQSYLESYTHKLCFRPWLKFWPFMLCIHQWFQRNCFQSGLAQLRKISTYWTTELKTELRINWVSPRYFQILLWVRSIP